MKARIEKKLSKRLVQIAPEIFKGAWVYYGEPSDLAYDQGTRVSHVMHIGGEPDYWGELSDVYTCWEWWKSNWYWHGNFKPYPSGHRHEFFPNTEGFKPTTRNLLKLAAGISP